MENSFCYRYEWNVYYCSSLSSLPDLSKWNTNNVNYMNRMFYDCLSLSSLPDISKWNTNNVTNMSDMFFNCFSLSSLPDISKWNTNNFIDMIGMFANCILLLHVPNLQNNSYDDSISDNFDFEEYELDDDDINHKEGNNNINI